MKKAFYLFSILVFILSACSTSVEYPPTSEPTITPEPTPTNLPTPTPIPIHPTGLIVEHEADSKIIWDWMTYVPRNLNRSKPVYILLVGIHGNVSGNYSEQKANSRALLESAINWLGIDNFVLLTPVIPRENDSYPVVFAYDSFLDTDEMNNRADLKVISMIDEFKEILSIDGYEVNPKVMIQGFSAGGCFAQRFSLLHPEMVEAIAIGGMGGVFTLPEKTHLENMIDYPIGIGDLEEISGILFDKEEYKKIKQFVFYGEEDTGKNYNTFVNLSSWSRESGGFWKSHSQKNYINQYFGDKDYIRVQNQIQYLNSIGYNNIFFNLYSDIGHNVSNEIISDFMKFFLENDSNFIINLDIDLDGEPFEWKDIQPVIVDFANDSEAKEWMDLKKCVNEILRKNSDFPA